MSCVEVWPKSVEVQLWIYTLKAVIYIKHVTEGAKLDLVWLAPQDTRFN